MVGDDREVFGGGVEEWLDLMVWAKKRAGLSDRVLAQRMGVVPTTIQEYREGKRGRVKPGWLFTVQWLRACGCRVVVGA